MLRYLWAAFAARPRVPGLGHVPANLLAVVATAALGIAHPAVWLAGLGLETAYLFGLASNGRFQAWVDAARGAGAKASATSPDADRLSLRDLPADDRRRYQGLEDRLAEVRSLYRKARAEEFGAQANEEALGALLRSFAQLLVVRNDLNAHWVGDPQKIAREAQELEEGLKLPELSEDLRRSRLATLEILQARLENQGRRDAVLQEIAAELRRIEVQFDLALENAAISGRPYTVPADVLFDLSKVAPELLSDPPAVAGAAAVGRRRAAVRSS